MTRRNQVDTFEAGKTAGPYDEYPVLLQEVDPQLHLSRNDRPQPFHLTFEKDTMLMQLSGSARIEMRDSSVLFFDAVQGDYVYVPAGVPHRIVPAEPSVMYRYKARDAGLEAATFYCETCGELLLRDTWDTADERPQSAYQRVVATFNDDPQMRTCSKGHVHPEIDLSDFRWKDIADELSQANSEEAW